MRRLDAVHARHLPHHELRVHVHVHARDVVAPCQPQRQQQPLVLGRVVGIALAQVQCLRRQHALRRRVHQQRAAAALSWVSTARAVCEREHHRIVAVLCQWLWTQSAQRATRRRDCGSTGVGPANIPSRGGSPILSKAASNDTSANEVEIECSDQRCSIPALSLSLPLSVHPLLSTASFRLPSVRTYQYSTSPRSFPNLSGTGRGRGCGAAWRRGPPSTPCTARRRPPRARRASSSSSSCGRRRRAQAARGPRRPRSPRSRPWPLSTSALSTSLSSWRWKVNEQMPSLLLLVVVIGAAVLVPFVYIAVTWDHDVAYTYAAPAPIPLSLSIASATSSRHPTRS
ncbi:hypothetical protein PybrP1_008303 [[Pythium] brassicae (nom. inval.)]|nr:hypothetical protein PybrP1_008303 [[Pythium] brassicae (nom. inval.)]